MTDRIVVFNKTEKVVVVSGGPRGLQGPGIESNITRITASDIPPTNPRVNDLWVDTADH